MRRIQALPRRHPGLDTLKGAVLSDELDPELQAISEQTSREVGTPIALVSLILERVQFLRAHHGLPPELAAARATDRDMSFCQFVVRDRSSFEVNDAVIDERVPQELVDRYGIAAYLGAPITIDGQVVGSMCAIDVKPRAFTDADRAIVARMAEAASKRLAVLALTSRDRERELHDRAVRPVFGEIRNRLQPFLGNMSSMAVALTELAASQRLARHVAETGEVAHLGLLVRADEIVAELRDALDDIVTEADQIHRAIVALERATLVTAAGCALVDVVDAATTLAHHRTKLVAGVRWHGDRRATLRAPRAVAINAVAAALGCLADAIYATRDPRGIDATIAMEGTVAVIQLTTGLENAALTEVAHHLMLLLGDTADIGVFVSGGVLELELAVRPAAVLRVGPVAGART
jgi:hypothetical protein